MSALAVPILTARARRINEAHRKSTGAGRSMLAYAIEAGQELIEAKGSLQHGEFQKWCAAHLTFGDRQVQKYMRLAKCDPQFAFEVGINAALEALATPKAPSPLPLLTRDDASRILKLAASANGGNVHEEAVAQDILDKMAARFGMTGEEAQAAAGKLRPDMVPEKVAATEARERNMIAGYDAVLAEVAARVPEEWGALDRDALLRAIIVALTELELESGQRPKTGK